jgi:endo-alpha-1,4-polygalactosaminidase (GH114 family)
MYDAHDLVEMWDYLKNKRRKSVSARQETINQINDAGMLHNDAMPSLQSAAEDIWHIDKKLKEIHQLVKVVLQDENTVQHLNKKLQRRLREIRGVSESLLIMSDLGDCLLEINELWKKLYFPGELTFHIDYPTEGKPSNNTITAVPTAGSGEISAESIDPVFISIVKSVLAKHVLFGEFFIKDRR